MEEKLIKLILDLSTKWNMSPEKVVDRLNFMNESEINKTVKSMTNRFKSGGLIECLKAGGSVKDCGCGSKMVKKGASGLVTDEPLQHTYYYPNGFQAIVTRFSNNPQYTRQDGKGKYSGQVRPNGVKQIEIDGPYTQYEYKIHPNGKRTIYDSSNGGTTYDHPESTRNSIFRKTAPQDLVDMVDNVESRFTEDPSKKENGGELKKYIGALPKKKKNYLKK